MINQNIPTHRIASRCADAGRTVQFANVYYALSMDDGARNRECTRRHAHLMIGTDHYNYYYLLLLRTPHRAGVQEPSFTLTYFA